MISWLNWVIMSITRVKCILHQVKGYNKLELWRWPPHRLSKRQLLSTTVLKDSCRSTLTLMIIFHLLQCSTFRKKSWGQLAPKFSFFVARTSILDAKNYINGFSFVKDNRLSLVYVFPKKNVTYLGGQVGDQAWKFGRHWVKAGRIGDPTGCNVEPCTHRSMSYQ